MKRGMISLKQETKKIIKGKQRIKLSEVSEKLNISPQLAGAVLRKLGMENICPYREEAIFVKAE